MSPHPSRRENMGHLTRIEVVPDPSTSDPLPYYRKNGEYIHSSVRYPVS